MSAILISVFTTEEINSKNVAEKCLALLENHHLLPQKIDMHEPVRGNFTHKDFIDHWTTETDGCYEDGIGMTGKAGGLLAKSVNPKFRMNMNWWVCPDKVNVNYIDFEIPIKTYEKYGDKLNQLFKDLIELLHAFYGYISHSHPMNRQHVAGNLQTRLPGVFWCNYYGHEYVEFLGEKNISNFDWFSTEALPSGILTYLSEHPNEQLIKNDRLERKAKKFIGEEYFGDPDQFEQNPEGIQKKKVPCFLKD